MKNKIGQFFTFLLFGTIIIGLLLGVTWEYHNEINNARENYLHEQHLYSVEISNNLTFHFNELYRGLRTITRLPAIKKLEQYTLDFDLNARMVVQELYNNIATTSSLSEVYITPVDFNAEKAHQTLLSGTDPNIMFDQLIVGRTSLNKNNHKNSNPNIDAEEIEIFEYQLIERQLQWFKKYFSNESTFEGLHVPAITGPEVITCDNTQFNPYLPDDLDRSGMVYSLPFYSTNGELKGAVSGIFLTKVLRDLLPNDAYTLLNTEHTTFIAKNQKNHTSTENLYMQKSVPDPNLIYSEMLPINITDGRHQWKLWVGTPDKLFWNRIDVYMAKKSAWLGYTGITLLLILFFTGLFLIERDRRLAEKMNDKLEQRVAERTKELELSNKKLTYTATHDSLTNMPNRTMLISQFNRTLQIARTKNLPVAIMIIDLDKFKAVNDSLGHRLGDALLIQVGEHLKTTLEKTAAISRLGGDEFAIVLPDADEDIAKKTAEQILDSFHTEFTVQDQKIYVEVSMGIAIFPEQGEDVSTLLRLADIAMYEAKNKKTKYMVYNTLFDTYSPNHLNLINDLRTAIEQEKLELHYQPQMDLLTNVPVGAEALCRWPKDDQYIPPFDFIPLAEESNLIFPLTTWALKTAIKQCTQWHEDGLNIGISVNLSARNLADHTLIKQIKEFLETHHLAPHWLTLEVTETAIMSFQEQAIETLKAISAIGVKLAIDDFGVGQSSFAYLKKMPINEIKIDRSFITDLKEKEGHEIIVRSIIDMAHSLGLYVTAEGIEDLETLKILQRLKCNTSQGYFTGHPMAIERFNEWITEKKTFS